jgi:hypothetical protein
MRRALLDRPVPDAGLLAPIAAFPRRICEAYETTKVEWDASGDEK